MVASPAQVRFTHDERCAELARYFLADENLPARALSDATEVLAQEIKDTVADFLEYTLPRVRRLRKPRA